MALPVVVELYLDRKADKSAWVDFVDPCSPSAAIKTLQFDSDNSLTRRA